MKRTIATILVLSAPSVSMALPTIALLLDGEEGRTRVRLQQVIRFAEVGPYWWFGRLEVVQTAHRYVSHPLLRGLDANETQAECTLRGDGSDPKCGEPGDACDAPEGRSTSGGLVLDLIPAWRPAGSMLWADKPMLPGPSFPGMPPWGLLASR
jgi:hypothetical protein